jgi:hypothetical protein
MTIRKPDKRVLTADQWAWFAAREGFRGDKLVTMVAIIGAESGFDAHAVGDVDLTEPGEQSTGGGQVHYRPSRDGRPDQAGIRNPHRLFDPAFNMRACWVISGGGAKFSPWTTYSNGDYRQFYAAAQIAARSVGSPGNAAGVADLGGSAIVYRGRDEAPGLPIRLGGLALRGEVGDAVVGGSVDLSTDEVSEITLEFHDPKLQRLSVGRLSLGTPLDYLDMHFTVVSLEAFQGPTDPHLRLVAHPTGAVRMREDAPNPAKGLSPTQYMAAIAKAAGLGFLGEASAPRTDIGPSTIEDDSGTFPVRRSETAWEIGQRLSEELGFLAFEAGGTYHFGRPTWLVRQGQSRHVVWLNRQTFLGAESGEPIGLIELPTCTASRTREGSGFQAVQIEALVPRRQGEAFRPGGNLLLSGVPRFEGGGRMITRVSWDLDDLVSPVSVHAESYEPLRATARTGADDRASTAPVSIVDTTARKGTRSALDFVNFCLQQVGKRYVFGAEARLDDADPDAFDCSELIEWACAQVGVKFVDGSVNQIAAIRRAGLTMSIDAAARTRGAVLFRKGNPNHIAVCLGDGRSTVEARGRAYGVVQHTIAGRGWTEAGKIPGLVYG